MPSARTAIHGGTSDLDIVPDPDPQNLVRLATALTRLGASVLGSEEFGGNFILTTRYGRLDVMQMVSPDLEYGDFDDAAIEDEVLGHRVRFCGYEHLVAMKEAAGRDQDLVDLRRLREARGE